MCPCGERTFLFSTHPRAIVWSDGMLFYSRDEDGKRTAPQFVWKCVMCERREDMSERVVSCQKCRLHAPVKFFRAIHEVDDLLPKQKHLLIELPWLVTPAHRLDPHRRLVEVTAEDVAVHLAAAPGRFVTSRDPVDHGEAPSLLSACPACGGRAGMVLYTDPLQRHCSCGTIYEIKSAPEAGLEKGGL